MMGNIQRLGNGAERAGHAAERVGHGAGRAGHWAGHVARGGGQNALHTMRRLGTNLGRKALTTGATAAAGPIGTVAAKIATDRRALLLILLIFLGFMYIMFMSGGDDNPLTPNPYGANPLQIIKYGPNTAKKNDILQYTITVVYPGSAQDAVITDPLPDGTTYFCSSVGTNPCKKGDNKGKSANNTVTWDAKNLKIPLTNPINFTLTLGLRATKDNNNVGNIATVSLTGGVLADGGAGGVPDTKYVAPNTNDCNGKYATQIANNYLLHKNFGDPQCNFSKDQVNAELKQQDAKDAAVFFTIIIPCESGWIPNTWASPAIGTPNSQGAWGLFQMGDSRPPGGPVTGTINDRGDVNWPLQVQSATNKAKTLKSLNSANGGYWSSLDWSRCG